MNKPNNKRSRDTDEAIVRAAFAVMLDGNRPISKITVREICEMAEINRSTFYAHYVDVYDLFDKVERQIAQMCADTLLTSITSGGLQAAIEGLFAFVAGYREFYQLYFKEIGKMSHLIALMLEPFENQIKQLKARDMGYGVDNEMLYHFHFFTVGLGALLSQWIKNGCKESPSQMYGVLLREYGPNSLLNTWTRNG